MEVKRLPLVKCRACGIKDIDRNIQIEGEDWVCPSKNYFYHKKCYESWAKKNDDIHAKATDEEWYQALLYYLNHSIKAPIDYKKLRSQWMNYTKQKTKTAKGIYLAVRYFYEVIRGDKEKSQGGIGIISFIYEDSCSYWRTRESREAGICSRIEQQIISFSREQKEIITRKSSKKKEKAQQAMLKDLQELEDNE